MDICSFLNEMNINTEPVGAFCISNICFCIQSTKDMVEICLEFLKEWNTVSLNALNIEYNYISLINNEKVFKQLLLFQNQTYIRDNYKIIREGGVLNIFIKNAKRAYVVLKNIHVLGQMYNMIRAEIISHIMHRLEYNNKFVFHASAVYFKQKIIIFLGRSRSGKSTNYIKLIQDGWNPISDDKVVIYDDETNGLFIESFGNSFQLRKDMLKQNDLKKYVESNCMPLNHFISDQNNDAKRFLPLHIVHFAKHLDCFALVFLDWKYKHMISLQAHEAMKLMIESSMLVSRIWREENKNITCNFINIITKLLSCATKNIACNGLNFDFSKEEILNALFK